MDNRFGRADVLANNAAINDGSGPVVPVADGAASVRWAVLLPDDGPSGGLYRDGHPLPW